MYSMYLAAKDVCATFRLPIVLTRVFACIISLRGYREVASLAIVSLSDGVFAAGKPGRRAARCVYELNKYVSHTQQLKRLSPTWKSPTRPQGSYLIFCAIILTSVLGAHKNGIFVDLLKTVLEWIDSMSSKLLNHFYYKTLVMYLD